MARGNFTVNNIVYKSMTLHMWLSICTFLQKFMALSFSVFGLCWLETPTFQLARRGRKAIRIRITVPEQFTVVCGGLYSGETGENIKASVRGDVSS